MKNHSAGFLKITLIAGVMCTGFGIASADPPAGALSKRPSPQELAAHATLLLKELQEFGAAIEPGFKQDIGVLQVACKCGPSIKPNGIITVPVPPPTPPLDASEIERAITLLAAVNQMKIPEMHFEKTTVKITGAGER